MEWSQAVRSTCRQGEQHSGVGGPWLPALIPAVVASSQQLAAGETHDHVRSESSHFTRPPLGRAEMLIRKPVAEVFEAFVDPAITSQFWFTKGSGRLEPGKRVQWDWEMYGFSVQVDVKEVEQDKRIRVEWSGYDAPTIIEWVFTPRVDDTTFVSVTNSGFQGTGDEVVAQAISATEGFSFVLAGLKALLEHNIDLRLVPDRLPDGIDAS